MHMDDLEDIINADPLNEVTGGDDEMSALEAALEHAGELAEAVALHAAASGDPGAIEAAVEAGAISRPLGEALAGGGTPPGLASGGHPPGRHPLVDLGCGSRGRR